MVYAGAAYTRGRAYGGRGVCYKGMGKDDTTLYTFMGGVVTKWDSHKRWVSSDRLINLPVGGLIHLRVTNSLLPLVRK